MPEQYNHRNCQSLFGYAAEVHRRSRGRCQLCGCGGQGDFDLWRQMTVEHLIGASQGGYPGQIREAIMQQFPGLCAEDVDRLVQRVDEANTVTACSFCNSTTSRRRNQKTMQELLGEAGGLPDEAVGKVIAELDQVLSQKKADVAWKLESVREAFVEQVRPELLREERDHV